MRWRVSRADTTPAHTLVISGFEDRAAPDSIGILRESVLCPDRQRRRAVSCGAAAGSGELEGRGVDVRSRLKIESGHAADPCRSTSHWTRPREGQRQGCHRPPTGRGTGRPFTKTRRRVAAFAWPTSYIRTSSRKNCAAWSVTCFVLKHWLEGRRGRLQKLLDEGLLEFGDYVKPMIDDVSTTLLRAAPRRQEHPVRGCAGSAAGHRNHGTCPCVRPRPTATVGGAYYAGGTGVGAGDIDYVLGICKAYATLASAAARSRQSWTIPQAKPCKRGNGVAPPPDAAPLPGWIDLVALKRAGADQRHQWPAQRSPSSMCSMGCLRSRSAWPCRYRGKRRDELAPLSAASWDEYRPGVPAIPWLGRIHLQNTRFFQKLPPCRACLPALGRGTGGSRISPWRGHRRGPRRYDCAEGSVRPQAYALMAFDQRQGACHDDAIRTLHRLRYLRGVALQLRLQAFTIATLQGVPESNAASGPEAGDLHWRLLGPFRASWSTMVKGIAD